MNMKTRMVSSVPPWNAGSANASAMKPPSGSTSALIICTISPGEMCRKCGNGKRSTRENSS